MYINIFESLITLAGVANYDPVGRVVNWNVSGTYKYLYMNVWWLAECLTCFLSTRSEKLLPRSTLQLLEV